MVEMGLRLALAGVLAGAVVAKLARPRAALDGLAAFGFRSPLAARAGLVALILVEAGLAAGVVAGSGEAAWLGAALMALFALSLVGAIAAGRTGEPCACFGARSRIGWPAVARNAVLAAGFAAVALLPSEELSTEQWLGLGLIGAFAATAALGAAVLALAREVGLLRLRVGPASALEIPSEGPELGSRTDVIGRIPPKPGAELWLAVFTSEGCAVCAALGPAVDSVAAHPAVAVGRFDEVVDADVWLELNVPGSPFAVALDAQGTVLAKGTFNNLAQLESVLAAGERRRGEAVASG